MSWVTNTVLEFDDATPAAAANVYFTPVNRRGVELGVTLAGVTNGSGVWLAQLAANIAPDGSALASTIPPAWRVLEAQPGHDPATTLVDEAAFPVATSYIRVQDGWAFTADPATDILTAAGNTFAAANRVRVEGAALPAPLVGTTDYYVLGSGTTFQLALTVGGAAIDITAAGSGPMVIQKVLSLPNLLTAPPGTVLNTGGAQASTQYQLPTKYASGADPAAPATGSIHYVRDDGTGKAQFCVRFADGTIGVLSTSAGASA